MTWKTMRWECCRGRLSTPSSRVLTPGVYTYGESGLDTAEAWAIMDDDDTTDKTTTRRLAKQRRGKEKNNAHVLHTCIPILCPLTCVCLLHVFTYTLTFSPVQPVRSTITLAYSPTQICALFMPRLHIALPVMLCTVYPPSTERLRVPVLELSLSQYTSCFVILLQENLDCGAFILSYSDHLSGSPPVFSSLVYFSSLRFTHVAIRRLPSTLRRGASRSIRLHAHGYDVQRPHTRRKD
jgi:hypothetical protein